ncbi:precorrin-3B synthase [Mycolicibacterium sp. 018/SC-01/001]|uniref:precorrin-3B synthase n=1 Tax=Mycolicibacterium sp. 018/SC-01/001 TaxID=2592069 RepID=UPI001180BDE9|nr:precorrin-3B synthase [Mycolicibacterium sp. 018/SC-01/001]TRW78991.1 precorrin-3B synthase [Mycolicibacterium sp. 018/SC-01/001]
MARTRDTDACPGALQTHRAADGELARVRLPAGMLTAAQMEAIATAALDLASPALELTSRGNLQIRGIRDAAELARRLTEAGLLPSPSREKIRNIVASPLSGRQGGLLDVRALVHTLDAELQADPVLADLPGRFLFGLDDGRGDIAGLAADAAVCAVDENTVAVVLSGIDTGVRVPVADAVHTLLAIARHFVEVRGSAWRIRELTTPDVVLGSLTATEPAGRTWPATTRPPVGWIPQDDGRVALGAAVPLGVLDAELGRYLAVMQAPLVITPWRSVVVADLDDGVADAALRVLAPLGFVFDEASPWLTLSACTGRPGCTHALADVRADAAAALEEGDPARRRHFVGCDRACGSPADGDVLIATGDGYRARRAHP